MRRYQKTLLLLLLSAIMVLTAGCVQEDPVDEGGAVQESSGSHDTPSFDVIRFETDNETYGSHEDLEAVVTLESTTGVRNAGARLVGIQPYNNPYIDERRIVNLTKGENRIAFEATTPHCTSGCGGVYPGPYDLVFELFVNDTVIANTTKTIELEGG
ncbi:MAG: hypothetical protein ACLFO2_00740 [Candidatus Woesearchaeota archaeon]